MRDVFLSHATQDKSALVVPFAKALGESGISYWLDEAEIRWGDRISARINEGLATSRYVIVFLTPAFVGRNWTEVELSAAITRENTEGRTVVLPIVTHPQVVLQKYPLLGDKKYLQWQGDPVPLVETLRELLVSQKARAEERLRLLVADRMSGHRRTAEQLRAAMLQPDLEEFALLELVLHEFSRLGANAGTESILPLAGRPASEPYVRRSLGFIRALCLGGRGDVQGAAQALAAANAEPAPTGLEKHYLAVQEGLAWLMTGDTAKADAAWDDLNGSDAEATAASYPFSAATRPFARSLLSVIASKVPVDQIVDALPVTEFRGIAHLSAESARVARLAPGLLSCIEGWAVAESWRARPSRQTLSGRLHTFEKLVLSRAGSLFE